MQESDRPTTVFRISSGHHEFRLLPFGHTNELATFPAVMNRMFQHLEFLNDIKVNPLAATSGFVLVCIDDILVFNKLVLRPLKSTLSMSRLSQRHCAGVPYSSRCVNAHEARLNCLIHVWATL